jgi:hypothetical protein
MEEIPANVPPEFRLENQPEKVPFRFIVELLPELEGGIQRPIQLGSRQIGTTPMNV